MAKEMWKWGRTAKVESPIGLCRVQHPAGRNPVYKVRKYLREGAMWQSLVLQDRAGLRPMWLLLGYSKTQHAARLECERHWRLITPELQPVKPKAKPTTRKRTKKS